jgi:hypothetical protein
VALAERAAPQRERFAELLARILAALHTPVRLLSSPHACFRFCARMLLLSRALARARALRCVLRTVMHTRMRRQQRVRSGAEGAACRICAQGRCAFSASEEAALQRLFGFDAPQLAALLDGAAAAFRRAAADGANPQARACACACAWAQACADAR